MRILDLMSKEKIIDSMKNQYCSGCIAYNECYQEIIINRHNNESRIPCGYLKANFLNKEVEIDKKRRCDIYTREELQKQYEKACLNSRGICRVCKYYEEDTLCEFNIAYDEVKVVYDPEYRIFSSEELQSNHIVALDKFAIKENVNAGKNRRCDVYSKEEIASAWEDYWDKHCNINCNYCRRLTKHGDIACEINFIYDEIESID